MDWISILLTARWAAVYGSPIGNSIPWSSATFLHLVTGTSPFLNFWSQYLETSNSYWACHFSSSSSSHSPFHSFNKNVLCMVVPETCSPKGTQSGKPSVWSLLDFSVTTALVKFFVTQFWITLTLYFLNYLFIWLPQVLVVARWIFDLCCGTWDLFSYSIQTLGYGVWDLSSLARDWTWAPCI